MDLAQEDLPWNLRYTSQRILLDHAFSSRERYIAQLMKGGWMVRDEKGLRSVIPGKKRYGRNWSN